MCKLSKLNVNMNLLKFSKLIVLTLMMTLNQACGLAGQDDECDNPHPSQKSECEARDSSEWNKMNWNEGTWG